MKIGYFHIGIPQSHESGVTRYGRLIAAEAKERTELRVIEADALLTTNSSLNIKLLSHAAKKLSEADIIHIQFNKHTWGGSKKQFDYLQTFVQHCSSPIVVTVHDLYAVVYPRYPLLTTLYRTMREFFNHQENPTSIVERQRRNWQEFITDRLPLNWLSNQAHRIFFCSQEEALRVSHLVDQKKARVIPHFVEQRIPKMGKLAARYALGLNQNHKIITLQGFIYSAKGHRILVNAMPYLPPEVQVIFAGGVAPGQESFLENLLKQAEDLGVRDRLHYTGYLSDSELEQYLIASDLGICPFIVFSASGSLSTWISLGCRILASDLPQITEYNTLEPDAIKTFTPYTPEALAEAINRCLSEPASDHIEAVIRLKNKLALPLILDEHLKQYQDVITSG